MLSHCWNLRRRTLSLLLNEISVSNGQYVGQGELLGTVGTTGYSTGPHLHFELRVGGNPVDPAQYML